MAPSGKFHNWQSRNVESIHSRISQQNNNSNSSLANEYYGFFSTMDGEAPGNYGLMDQQAAMQWVKTNINLFGGNPNNICLMGYGTGAMSVGLHMINPQSRDLFDKAIAMSGNLLSPQG